MNCFICGEEVIWGNDFDAEDVVGESDYLIVSNYSCPECEAFYEVSHSKRSEDDKDYE